MPLENLYLFMRQALKTVGVRDTNEKLVGISILSGSRDEAILGGLAVDPAHQHRGLAKAMTDITVEAADQLGVRQIVAELSATNSLQTYYQQLGFMLLAGSQPPRLIRSRA